NRLQLSLDKKNRNSFEIYNLGVSGDTTEELLKRIEPECKARLKGEEAEWYSDNFVVIEIGANDAGLTSGNEMVTFEKFKKNISKIAGIAGKYADHVMFVGCGLVDEKRTTPVSFDESLFYTNERNKTYSNAIKQMCEEKKLIFVDVMAPLSKTKNVLDDGLHLNARGHAVVADAVEKTLVKAGFLR
ncbi:hypothetical protein H0N95_02090, partial [Candidatus Micrarchaeota archaeon]|nr:hypothetical protein [Candidatus Micrarchaeota archaeon]